MKAIMVIAIAMALAGAFSAPALAQQASEQVAASSSGGQCAISQAMLQAMADGKHQQMRETKSKIDLLIENALASSRTAKLAHVQVYPAKGSPDS